MTEPVVVTRKPNRAKVGGAVMCMVATIGCIAGGATGSPALLVPCIFLFLFGLGGFVAGRLRD